MPALCLPTERLTVGTCGRGTIAARRPWEPAFPALRFMNRVGLCVTSHPLCSLAFCAKQVLDPICALGTHNSGGCCCREGSCCPLLNYPAIIFGTSISSGVYARAMLLSVLLAMVFCKGSRACHCEWLCLARWASLT